MRAPHERPSRIVQVVRSFTFRLNVGNYESRDFFCSQRAECFAADAEETSARVHDFCKRAVLADVRRYKADQSAEHDETMREAKAVLQERHTEALKARTT